MSEAPMGKYFSGGIHPGTGNKIDVGDALCQGTPEHGFFTETFFKKSLADAGSDGDMRDAVHGLLRIGSFHLSDKDRPFLPEWLNSHYFCVSKRRDAGVAERGGLENRYTSNGIQGSNPCLSAK